MKHLLTAFACLLAMSLSAQTGFVEFPYNPDSDNDDMIGTEDLLGLLSLYGSEFSEEGLYVNENETSALYWTGIQNFGMCKATCADLPGRWVMMDMDDWAHFHNEVESTESTNGFAWLGNLEYSIIDNMAFPLPAVSRGVLDGWGKGELTSLALNDACECFCATHERPKVEYSYCEAVDIEVCAEAKVQDGWYPLGGISTIAYNGLKKIQAFWRWAE